MAAGVSAISGQVNIILVKLQGSNLLISQQRQELDNLAAIICTQIVVEGPFTEVELNAVNKTTHITYSRWCITRENTINYLFVIGALVILLQGRPSIRAELRCLVMKTCHF